MTTSRGRGRGVWGYARDAATLGHGAAVHFVYVGPEGAGRSGSDVVADSKGIDGRLQLDHLADPVRREAAAYHDLDVAEPSQVKARPDLLDEVGGIRPPSRQGCPA